MRLHKNINTTIYSLPVFLVGTVESSTGHSSTSSSDPVPSSGACLLLWLHVLTVTSFIIDAAPVVVLCLLIRPVGFSVVVTLEESVRPFFTVDAPFLVSTDPNVSVYSACT